MGKSVLASLIVPTESNEETNIGHISLRPHQTDGLTRILRSFENFGGALLCDKVGLGKTFTAAAVIRSFASAVVIAPASLLSMWERELRRTAITATLISQEKFSRSAVPRSSAQLVVVDEAHHFRNARTNRFRHLAAYLDESRVLLLTATPVHNRRTDVLTLLSLFLGRRATLLTDSEFSECVIRREATEGLAFPKRIYHAAQSPPYSAGLRQQIVDLPSPIPPRDGDDCATLVRFTLLRQWSSSDAALKAGLKTRLSRAHALINALEQGTYPTRTELEVWLTGGADVQLGFAGILASAGGDEDLLTAVRVHEAATSKLYALLAGASAADEWRVEYLRSLRKKYDGRKIVAFTQFASTARQMFSAMKGDPYVGIITAERSEVASGPVTREFILRRFAPISTASDVPPAREAITLLIATDLCSEGLNLQDASVVVHLDMPWTPARVEQRVGRIARPGGLNPEVFVHSISIPEIADDLLRMAARLREKSLIASAIVGADESASPDGDILSVPDATQQVARILQDWKGYATGEFSGEPVSCGIAADKDCFVAAVRVTDSTIIVAGDDFNTTRDPRQILQILFTLSNQDAAVDQSHVVAILARIQAFVSQQRLERRLGIHRSDAESRKAVVRRIDAVTSCLPIHKRAMTATLADSARRAVAGDFNAAAESRLTALTQAEMHDREWLREIIATPMSRKTKAEPINGSGFEVLALLIGRRC